MPHSATQLITNAMFKLGYLEAAETPTPHDIAACFDAAQALLEASALRRTLIYYTDRVVVPLQNGKQTYTIGVGGDIDRARPLMIDLCGIVPQRDPGANQLELPMMRPLMLEEYRQIRMKSIVSHYPRAIYYDYAWNDGLGNISVYPIPTYSTADLILYIPTQLTQFADATTQYTFPPGYRRFIEHAFALEFAPILGAIPSPDIRTNHDEALLWVEVGNFRPSELAIDPVLLPARRRGSIETGNVS